MDSNSSSIKEISTDVSTLEIKGKEELIQASDPLELKIADKELCQIIDKRDKDSKDFYEKSYDLYNRRRTNEMYLFGRQIKDKENKKELKDWENRVNDNALYEIEASIKPLAMSRLPDMIVTAGQDNPDSKESAKTVTEIINDQIKQRKTRQALGLCFKHLPVYFTGVLKCVWDAEIGEGGDYKFVVIHPDNVIVDHTCPNNNAEDMEYVTEFLPLTVQQIVIRFPDKKEVFLAEFRKRAGLEVGMPLSYTHMASELKITETHFTSYTQQNSGVASTEPAVVSEPGNKWIRDEAIVWKYGKVVLKKMLTPNFDHEGEMRYFTYENLADKNTKQPIPQDQLVDMAVTGTSPDNVTKETTYRNYFKAPRKPYYFFGYDQWGKMPYDETSRIEQNIRNQEFLDKMSKQIVDTLANRGKHAFSKDSGIKAEDLEKMDTRDPNQNFLVDGKVSEVHEYMPPERPSAPEFTAIQDARGRMYAISGSTAVRGQIQSDTATTNQIAREADFSRADDLVEDTINAASEWVSQWSLQMIRLRYTSEHFRKLVGSKGEVTFKRLHQDMVEDGMEVKIKSSSSDKIKTQNYAIQMAGIKMIDPLSFFEDMGMDDAQERAKRLMEFNLSPNQYIADYVMDANSTQAQVAALAAAPIPGANPQVPPAAAPGVPQNPMPQNPTPDNTAAVPITPPVIPTASPRNL